MSFKSSRIAVIGVSAAIIAAGFAGCGGSSDDESSGALSKEDFIAQADAICAKNRTESAESQGTAQAAMQAGDTDAAADALVEYQQLMVDAVDEVDALEPPEADADQIDQFVSISHEQADGLSEIADLVRDNDQKAVQAKGKELDDLAAQSNEIADAYGLKDCGSAGGAA